MSVVTVESAASPCDVQPYTKLILGAIVARATMPQSLTGGVTDCMTAAMVDGLDLSTDLALCSWGRLLDRAMEDRLAGLGLIPSWHQRHVEFSTFLLRLQSFYLATGHLHVPIAYVDGSGFSLGAALNRYRCLAARGVLPERYLDHLRRSGALVPRYDHVTLDDPRVLAWHLVWFTEVNGHRYIPVDTITFDGLPLGSAVAHAIHGLQEQYFRDDVTTLQHAIWRVVVRSGVLSGPVPEALQGPVFTLPLPTEERLAGRKAYGGVPPIRKQSVADVVFMLHEPLPFQRPIGVAPCEDTNTQVLDILSRIQSFWRRKERQPGRDALPRKLTADAESRGRRLSLYDEWDVVRSAYWDGLLSDTAMERLATLESRLGILSAPAPDGHYAAFARSMPHGGHVTAIR